MTSARVLDAGRISEFKSCAVAARLAAVWMRCLLPALGGCRALVGLTHAKACVSARPGEALTHAPRGILDRSGTPCQRARVLACPRRPGRWGGYGGGGREGYLQRQCTFYERHSSAVVEAKNCDPAKLRCEGYGWISRMRPFIRLSRIEARQFISPR